MKFKTIIIILLACIANVACNNNMDTKDTKKDTEKDLISINLIPSLEEYQSLKLTDVKWKLIGFADAKQEKIKMAEPESERCYLLQFNDDNTLSGMSSSNEIGGGYETSSESSMKIGARAHTKVNEIYDGELYMKCLNNVNTFSMTEKGLALYYDSNKFLLFKPIKP